MGSEKPVPVDENNGNYQIKSEEEIESLAKQAYLNWRREGESTPEYPHIVEIRDLLVASALDGIRQKFDREKDRRYHNSSHTRKAYSRLEKLIEEHNLSQFRKITRVGSKKKKEVARGNLIGPIEENLMYIAMAWHDYVQADLSKIFELPVGSKKSQVKIPKVIPAEDYEALSFEALRSELVDTGLISDPLFGNIESAGSKSNKSGLEFIKQLILGTKLVRIELDSGELGSLGKKPGHTGAISHSLAGLLIENGKIRIDKRQFMLGLFALADIGSYLEHNKSTIEQIMRDVLSLLSEQNPRMLDCLRLLVTDEWRSAENVNFIRATLYSIANFVAGQNEWINNLGGASKMLLPKPYYQLLKGRLDSLLQDVAKLQDDLSAVKNSTQDDFIRLIESDTPIVKTIRDILRILFGGFNNKNDSK